MPSRVRRRSPSLIEIVIFIALAGNLIALAIASR
jgi:hypothetical protein